MKSRKRTELTEDQVDHLADVVCQGGDDAQAHSEALLILMDQIERVDGSDIAWRIKRRAFARCGEDAMESFTKMIREVGGAYGTLKAN